MKYLIAIWEKNPDTQKIGASCGFIETDSGVPQLFFSEHDAVVKRINSNMTVPDRFYQEVKESFVP